jgi:hypothetical protein
MHRLPIAKTSRGRRFRSMTPLRFVPYVIGAGALAAIGVYGWARTRRKDPSARERERRDRLTAAGRIIDGTVTDVQELNHNGSGPIQLLFYRYEIAGVQYEASQDVTRLRQFIDVHSCRLGLPASIKYDPRNPGNSIVISENWTGLRQ